MKIRLWRLGSLEDRIFPTEKAIQKLADMLVSVDNNAELDIVWGPDITVQEIDVNQEDYDLLCTATPSGYEAKVVLFKK